MPVYFCSCLNSVLFISPAPLLHDVAKFQKCRTCRPNELRRIITSIMHARRVRPRRPNDIATGTAAQEPSSSSHAEDLLDRFRVHHCLHWYSIINRGFETNERFPFLSQKKRNIWHTWHGNIWVGRKTKICPNSTNMYRILTRQKSIES